MRKFFNTLLLVVVMTGAVHAQDVKNQFVKWASVPAEVTNGTVSAEKAGMWLKAAMNGKDIPGATVRTTAATYKAVWGNAEYDYVNSQTNFFLVPANGTEKNFALDANGNPVAAGFLKQGTKCIAVDVPGKGKVKVAKIGTNGCINAIIPGEKTVPDDADPDTQPSPFVGADPVKNPNGINITVNGQPAGQELSWTTGYAVYSQGRNDRQTDFIVDASLFKMIQDAKQCCGGTTQHPAQGWVMTGQSMPLPAQQVAVQQKIPAGLTIGGQVFANTVGTFLGNELSERFNLFGNGRYYNYGYYQTRQFGPGFQWDNYGYTDYSGGPIHPATGSIASPGSLIPGAGTGGGRVFGPGF